MQKDDSLSQQEYMFRLIEEWKSSGLGKYEFYRQAGITENSFRYWLRKYDRINGTVESSPESASGFISLDIDSGVNTISFPVEIHYPNGVMLKVSSSLELSALQSLLTLI